MNAFTRIVAFGRVHDVPVFLVCQAGALLVALWIFRKRLPPELRARFTLAFAGGAPSGAILLGIGLRLPAFLATSGTTSLIGSGWLSSYGALGGAVTAAALAGRLAGRDASVWCDAIAPALAILVAIGRLGCLGAGCDYGAPATLPWAITYPAGFPAGSHTVHPVQLYEAVLGVTALAAAELCRRRQTRAGAALTAVTVVYAVGRFGIEFLRGDSRPANGLSVAQWLSLVVVGLVVFRAMGGPSERLERRGTERPS